MPSAGPWAESPHLSHADSITILVSRYTLLKANIVFNLKESEMYLNGLNYVPKLETTETKKQAQDLSRQTNTGFWWTKFRRFEAN